MSTGIPVFERELESDDSEEVELDEAGASANLSYGYAKYCKSSTAVKEVDDSESELLDEHSLLMELFDPDNADCEDELLEENDDELSEELDTELVELELIELELPELIEGLEPDHELELDNEDKLELLSDVEDSLLVLDSLDELVELVEDSLLVLDSLDELVELVEDSLLVLDSLDELVEDSLLILEDDS